MEYLISIGIIVLILYLYFDDSVKIHALLREEAEALRALRKELDDARCGKVLLKQEQSKPDLGPLKSKRESSIEKQHTKL